MSHPTIMKSGDIIILLEGLICLYCFIFYKKMKQYNIQFFAWIYAIIFGFEMLIRFYLQSCKINHSVHSYFDLLQMLLWAYLYYQNSSHFKKTIIAISSICVVYFFININFIETQQGQLTTLSVALNSLSIAIISILYFVENIYYKGQFQFFTSPLFWISLGIFMYSLFTAPYYAMYNFYAGSQYDHFYKIYEMIILLLTITSYVLTFVGLLCIQQKKKQLEA